MKIPDYLMPKALGQRYMPLILKAHPYLKKLPVFRRYAEGGDLYVEPEKGEKI